uniref:Apple domain-containing protein n=1 Tax=Panagrolaimus sp. ES5 TaxID=591445 RepID=A0AC34FYU2_9BILA
MTGTDSIQFKDDCLRACLKTLFQSNFTCRSLMHMPRDDDCVLTSMSEYTGAKVEKVEDFGFMSTINYFENKCAKSPFGKHVKLSDRLLQMFTDSSGMAVYPWGDADLNVLGKNYLGSTVIIIDTMTQKVIDCGIIQIKGNPDEYEAIKIFGFEK